MPVGGLVTENERKSRLAENTSKARRQISVAQTMKGWEEKIKNKTRTNLALSNYFTQEMQNQGVTPRGLISNKILGRGSSSIQETLVPPPQEETEPEGLENQEEQNEEETEETNEAESAESQQQAANEMLMRQQQEARMEQMEEQLLEESGVGEGKSKAQEEVRKQAKNAIRRGVEELAQGIGNAFDVGTAGVSTIITVFMYAITLTDLNLQMIWGYYLTKKKSFFFPALEWSPIPMPKIVTPIILHAGLVMLDIMLVVGILTICSILIIFMTAPISVPAGIGLYFTNSGFNSWVNSLLF